MVKWFLLFVPVALVLGGWWLYTALAEPTPAPTNVVSVASSTAPTTGQVAATPLPTNAPGPAGQPTRTMQAILHTNQGDITLEFLPDAAPNAVANFTKLAQSGFYSGTKFHRVIKGFMDQGGDPLTKDDSKAAAWGTGGPGYKFADEVSAEAPNNTGFVAMANSGPNTNGSQFFINVADNTFLNGKYTVFAKVVAGMDVALAINNTPTNSADRPLTPVVLVSVEIK